jgi:hypothetical protein
MAKNLKLQTMKLKEQRMKAVIKVGRARSYGDLEITDLPNTGSKQTNKVISVRQVSHAGLTEEEGHLC